MIRITIDTKNAAFADDPGAELARILRQLADRLKPASYVGVKGWSIPLKDINGNTVGTAMEGQR